MKNSFEGISAHRTEHHELSPHEAALYLLLRDDVQEAVAAYQQQLQMNAPRDFATPANAVERTQAEDAIKAVLAKYNVVLKPFLKYGSDIALEEFVVECTKHHHS